MLRITNIYVVLYLLSSMINILSSAYFLKYNNISKYLDSFIQDRGYFTNFIMLEINLSIILGIN